jgi:hypothetical protein
MIRPTNPIHVRLPEVGHLFIYSLNTCLYDIYSLILIKPHTNRIEHTIIMNQLRHTYFRIAHVFNEVGQA